MEWPLNEWIRCCLYIETAPDSFIQRSFHIHSSLIRTLKNFRRKLYSVKGVIWELNLKMSSNEWNDLWCIGFWLRMTKWWWNEGDFRINGFALLQKYPSFHPHSVIPTAFWNDQSERNGVKMNGMPSDWYLSLVIFIPGHSELTENDQMRRNEGVFGSVQKYWILRHLSFWHHSVILSSLRNEVWMSFHIHSKKTCFSISLEWH